MFQIITVMAHTSWRCILFQIITYIFCYNTYWCNSYKQWFNNVSNNHGHVSYQLALHTVSNNPTTYNWVSNKFLHLWTNNFRFGQFRISGPNDSMLCVPLQKILSRYFCVLALGKLYISLYLMPYLCTFFNGFPYWSLIVQSTILFGNKLCLSLNPNFKFSSWISFSIVRIFKSLFVLRLSIRDIHLSWAFCNFCKVPLLTRLPHIDMQ